MARDLEDTWMNPPASRSWSWADREARRRENPWLIERCRRVPVSGNVASIEQWDVWSRHATKDERDAELRKLRSDHSWKLRPASEHPLMGTRVEVDEDAVLARAEVIRALREAKQKL